MSRISAVLSGVVFGVLLCAARLPAQDDFQRGKLAKVDPEKGTVTITLSGKEKEFSVSDDTRLVGPGGGDLEKRLRSAELTKGAVVLFKIVSRDGKDVLVGLKVLGREAGAGIRKARLVKLDLEGMTVTLGEGGHETKFALSEDTLTPGIEGKTLRERLRVFKEGLEVFFKVEKRDGKDVLIGFRPAGGAPGNGPRPAPKVDTSKLVPLTELGNGEYQGFKGGLYPGGKNERPRAHEEAGLALAKKVQPLDGTGKPAEDGKIVILSIGMSNTSQASEGFQRALAAEKKAVNPAVRFVNGAQGGMTAARIQDPASTSGKQYWMVVDRKLKEAGVTREQVQAAWIKQADAGPTQGFPKYARTLEEELGNVVRVLHDRFPNLKLVYLSGRTYGGYAKSALNPEPYAYESGFSVKWLVEAQIEGKAHLNFDPKKGQVKAPWLSWGPYLWANGQVKRVDGFSWEEKDFGPDGTHPSASGQQKVGKLLLEFFKSDTTTRGWFLKP